MALRSNYASVVRKRQAGTVSLTNGNATVDATISAVNTAKLEINFPQMIALDQASATEQWYYWTAIDSTTLRITRNDSGVPLAVTVYYEAIEYI